VDLTLLDQPPRAIALPDGRQLAWNEVGDPNGLPVLYCNGWPGTRLQAMLAHDDASRFGIRLIGYDRPGLGRSTRLPNRTIRDTPRDIAHLLDALGIDRVIAVGVSGGGPHASAIARWLPHRVRALALICPVAPSRHCSNLTHHTRLFFALARYAPSLLLPGVAAFAWSHRGHTFTRASPMAAPLLTAPDLAVLNDLSTGEALRRDIVEATRQGARATVEDIALSASICPDYPRAIVCPTFVYHGTRDHIVPISMSQWYADNIPGAKLSIVDGEGHISLPFNSLERVFPDLLPQG